MEIAVGSNELQTTQMTLQTMWTARQFEALAKRVRDVPDTEATEAEKRVLRARLASVGALSIAEGLGAARALHSERHAEADSCLCGILRCAAAAGCSEWARVVFAEYYPLPTEITEVELLRDQLDSPNILMGNAHSREFWDVLKTLADPVATEDVITQLTDLADKGADGFIPKHYELLASLRAEAQQFTLAADALKECQERWPDADGQGRRLFERGIYCWLSGDFDDAHHLFRSTRDCTSAETSVRHIARKWVADLERRDCQGEPDWVHASFATAEKKVPIPVGTPSGEAARRLGVAFAKRPQTEATIAIDSFAALRHQLEVAGVEIRRVALDETSLIAALEAGALIILGEERPLGVGFEAVVRFDRRSRTIVLRDGGRPGVCVRWLDDQWERSAFHGRSALLVLGEKNSPQAQTTGDALSAAEVIHDERFDRVDACDLDQQGQRPHRSRVDGLTERMIAELDSVAKSWQRRGVALRALQASGDLDNDDRNGPFQRWYAEARVRFESAEWAHQLYAEALEAESRYSEAGIAWSDAARLDDKDFRNYLGMARVRAATGFVSAAEKSVNRALVLEPSSAQAWTLSARLALARDQFDPAMLAADLAASLAPADVAVHHVRASVFEQRGQFDKACAVLATACEIDPDNVHSQARRCRRAIHAANWEEAQTSSRLLVERAPGQATSWTLASQVAFATGDLDAALAIARQGLEVVGPYSNIVSAFATAFVATATPQTDPSSLAPLLIHSTEAPYIVTDALLVEKQIDVAQRLFDAMVASQPGAINPLWRRVQAMIRQPLITGALPEGTIEELLEICEKAGAFPFPRVLAGWLLVDSDPTKALEIAAKADAEHAPPLVWTTLRHIFMKLGRGNEVAELNSRLESMDDEATFAAARGLADFGLVDAARAVLEQSSWLKNSGPKRLCEAFIANEEAHYAEVAAAMAAAVELDSLIKPGQMGAQAASMAGQWERALAWSEPVCTELEKLSNDNFEDPWRWLAIRAVGLAAGGDPSAKEHLLRVAPEHPEVLRVLCQASSHKAETSFETWSSKLAHVAPGWRLDNHHERVSS